MMAWQEFSFFFGPSKRFAWDPLPKLCAFVQKCADNFVPWPYQPENNDIPVKSPPTGFDALRTIAVSRIYLDNFDHITALRLSTASRENPNRFRLRCATTRQQFPAP